MKRPDHFSTSRLKASLFLQDQQLFSSFLRRGMTLLLVLCLALGIGARAHALTEAVNISPQSGTYQEDDDVPLHAFVTPGISNEFKPTSPPCCGNEEAEWVYKSHEITSWSGDYVDGSGSEAKLDTSSDGTKSVTAHATITWRCTATDATTTTTGYGTGTYEVEPADQYNVTISSPSPDKLLPVGHQMSLNAKASNGQEPYELKWTIEIDGVAQTLPNDTQNQATDSSAPTPAISFTIPESAKGKKISVKVEATDDSMASADDTNTVYVPKLKIKTMTFTSDQGILLNNTTTWGDTGTKYPKPEYNHAGDKNWPISHTWDKKGEVKLNIELLPSDIPAKSLTLKASSGNGFTFDEKKTLSGGDNNDIALTSNTKIDKKVHQLDVNLTWKLLDGTTELASDGSGGHEVFVLADAPATGSGVPTYKRVKFVATTGSGATTIDQAAEKLHVASFGNIIGSGDSFFWSLSDSSNKAQCNLCVRHHQRAIRMAGFALDSNTLTYVHPDHPGKAAFKTNVALQNRTKVVNQKTLYLVYTTAPVPAASGTHAPPLEQFGLNYFEACLELNGVLYLGGFPGVRKTTALDVLKHVAVNSVWYETTTSPYYYEREVVW